RPTPPPRLPYTTPFRSHPPPAHRGTPGRAGLRPHGTRGPPPPRRTRHHRPHAPHRAHLPTRPGRTRRPGTRGTGDAHGHHPASPLHLTRRRPGRGRPPLAGPGRTRRGDLTPADRPARHPPAHPCPTTPA